jgi:hypothetical protein
VIFQSKNYTANFYITGMAKHTSTLLVFMTPDNRCQPSTSPSSREAPELDIHSLLHPGLSSREAPISDIRFHLYLGPSSREASPQIATLPSIAPSHAWIPGTRILHTDHTHRAPAPSISVNLSRVHAMPRTPTFNPPLPLLAYPAHRLALAQPTSQSMLPLSLDILHIYAPSTTQTSLNS